MNNLQNRPKFTPENINALSPDEVFVFGSNLAGRHGSGAARAALDKFGAIYGQGVGLQGQSYAIPTMQGGVETIVPYVDEFIDFAKAHPEKFFYVTRIGCGIAGFRDEEIAPLFEKARNLDNVCLPESFVRLQCEQSKSCIAQEIENKQQFDHIQWLKRFQIASQNKRGFREERKEIFEGTVKYVQQNGYYIGSNHFAIDNDCIVSEYFNKPQKLSQSAKYDTMFSVINADCLETSEVLLNSGFNPCVLNLASRQNPGGGVLKGAGAQEENLFRRTNLFMSLFQYASYANEYGIKKSEYSYPLDRNTGGIYTENATVFRSSEKNGYCLLNKTFKMSFVTVAALSHPQLIKKDNLFYLIDELIEPTKEKIRTILRIAGKYKHDSLVLGAFGCGAFANPPNHIARLFKEVFLESEFFGVFKYVVFSIFEDHNSGLEHNPYGNVLPFFEVFNERTA